MQHRSLADTELGLKFRPLTVLHAESATGNNRTLWDRSFDSDPIACTPDDVACTLLAHQQFPPSGLIGAIRKSCQWSSASGSYEFQPAADLGE